MTLSLTWSAAPIFLSKNYFNRNADPDNSGDLAVSSGASLDHRLYDMDPAAQWTTADEDSDATLASIRSGLWLPGMQSARTIDLIALLNTNAKDLDIYTSADEGANWTSRFTDEDNALADIIIDLSATSPSADEFKVEILKTAVANAEKLVGSIVLASVLLQPSIGMSLFERLPFRQKVKKAVMADGSIRRANIYRSDGSAYFNDFRVGLAGITTAEADTLQGILLGDDPFIFYPEPNDKPEKMFLGQAIENTVTRNYVTRSKSGGEAITFDFEEIGGA